MISRPLLLPVAILFILVEPFAGWPCGTTDKSGEVAYLCDVLRAPAKYDGRVVTVRASYRIAYEAAELYCLACTNLGAVWVDFDSDEEKSIGKALRPLRRKIGTVNGVFTGTFSACGRCGNQKLYNFQMTVTSVRDVRLVDHQGFPPATLTPDSGAKVCQ